MFVLQPWLDYLEISAFVWTSQSPDVLLQNRTPPTSITFSTFTLAAIFQLIKLNSVGLCLKSDIQRNFIWINCRNKKLSVVCILFFFYKSCWPSSRTVSTNLKKCRLKVNIPLQFAMFLLKAKEGGKRKLFSFNFQQSTYLFSNSFSFCLPFLAPTGAFYVLVCHPARPVSQFSLSPLILSMIHSMTSWGHLLLHLLFLLFSDCVFFLQR